MKKLDVVWKTTLDKKYQVRVERVPNTGPSFLVISQGKKELHRELTAVSYGAVFGVDSGDIIGWQHRAIEIVDKELPKKRKRVK